MENLHIKLLVFPGNEKKSLIKAYIRLYEPFEIDVILDFLKSQTLATYCDSTSVGRGVTIIKLMGICSL